MKLNGATAITYCGKPDPNAAGALIYGADAMRVALRRQELIAALIGPEGEAEMRLTRMAGADLRRDAALLVDAIKAQGFFPGPRVAFVEEATETAAPAITAALLDWRPGDAQIVVTGNLTTKSAVVKLFDAHPTARSIGVYDDPPGRDEIAAILRKSGLTEISPQAMADLTALARDLDPGDFRQTVEKVALYKWGDPGPLLPEDVAACAPATIEAGVDDLVETVVEQRVAAIGGLVRRLEGQGVLPVTICIGMLRHFRLLQALLADPRGPVQYRLKGRQKEAMPRQAQAWGPHRTEEAIALLLDTDLTLRSASRAPSMALLERALIRLAMLKR